MYLLGCLFIFVVMYFKFLADLRFKIFPYLSVYRSQIFLTILFLIYSFGYLYKNEDLIYYTLSITSIFAQISSESQVGKGHSY